MNLMEDGDEAERMNTLDSTTTGDADADVESAFAGSDDDAPNDVAVPDGFEVRDDVSAAWVGRRVLEARAHAARVRAWAAAELRRAERDEAWLLRRFGPALEAWLRAELERRGGRRRSVALPPATIGLRRQPARLEVVDEAAAEAWCRRHLADALRVSVEAEGAAAVELAAWQAARGDASRLRRHLLRDPMARHLAATGELPTGTTLRAAEDGLYLK